MMDDMDKNHSVWELNMFIFYAPYVLSLDSTKYVYRHVLNVTGNSPHAC